MRYCISLLVSHIANGKHLNSLCKLLLYSPLEPFRTAISMQVWPPGCPLLPQIAPTWEVVPLPVLTVPPVSGYATGHCKCQLYLTLSITLQLCPSSNADVSRRSFLNNSQLGPVYIPDILLSLQYSVRNRWTKGYVTCMGTAEIMFILNLTKAWGVILEDSKQFLPVTCINCCQLCNQLLVLAQNRKLST